MTDIHPMGAPLSRARLMAGVLAVPALGVAIAVAVLAAFDGGLASPLPPQTEDGTRPDLNAGPRAGALCLKARLQSLPLSGCEVYDQVNLLLAGSIFAAFIGLGLLAFIVLAARWARGDRDRLVRVFRPGLFVVLIGLCGLLLLQGVIAVDVVYFALALALGLPVTLWILAAWAAAVVVAVVSGALALAWRGRNRIIGRRLFADDQARAVAFVGDIAGRLETAPPDDIIVGLQPTFFVTSVKILLVNRHRTYRGRTLYLSLPLMRLLTVPELSAVIGHELAHFRGRDADYSRRFSPVYAGAVGALAGLQQEGLQRGPLRLMAAPAVAVLSFFLERFSMAERAIGRERELAADQLGASVASAGALGVALAKLSAFEPLWNTIEKNVETLLAEQKMFENMSEEFAVAATEQGVIDQLRALMQRTLDHVVPHPTDTHPPLSARLAALGLDAADMLEAALLPVGEPSAGLINGLEAIEQELTLADSRQLSEAHSAKGHQTNS
jgi:Zn-dependent protease with chaperone function